MTTIPSIVCVGTVALDMILTADRLPPEDGRVEADQVALVGGGNAANAAVAIARLGLPVEFCGTIGDDRAGGLLLDELIAEGVGTSLVERRRGSVTAQTAVIVSSGTGARTIITRPAPPPPAIPRGFDITHLDKAGWGAMPREGVAGTRVSVDDGNLIPDLDLALLEWYVPTATVLRSRYGTTSIEAARRARLDGAATVIATDGARGSFAVDDSGLHFAPALPITPVSTLGAGDVFHGALVAAIALGRPMAAAIRFANVTAALSCRALDGRTGIPDRAEVDALVGALGDPRLSDREIAARFSNEDPA
ncbi:MAG: ribokinase [Naasia sp.]|uniref:PfkB family carbohydrate kinase n=1 Tax=Naasia sp. TaxID=2546198 RepID=UPI0026173B92|nr:PfkB family carbohydrate kinase [Naasia sp.]MCU1569944.1 ribokinase [Naasia sp.]